MAVSVLARSGCRPSTLRHPGVPNRGRDPYVKPHPSSGRKILRDVRRMSAPEATERQPRTAAPRTLTGDVNVKFFVHFQSRPGQQVYITGALPELGSWGFDNATGLRWTPGNFWVLDEPIRLAPDSCVEYKYVVFDEGSGQLSWQEGQNRIVHIPERLGSWEATSDEAWVVLDSWAGEEHSVLHESDAMQRLHRGPRRPSKPGLIHSRQIPMSCFLCARCTVPDPHACPLDLPPPANAPLAPPPLRGLANLPAPTPASRACVSPLL